MIYLNQAATTWPKPKTVEEAVEAALALPPFSQNRSGVGNDDKNVDAAGECRRRLAELFHIEDAKRIYYTSGATDSFNRIVRGLELEGTKVLLTQNEHNAVLRPLYNIYENIDIGIVGCDDKGNLNYEEFAEKLTDDVSAVFVNHCSNVTGVVVDLERIARIVHTKGIILVADVSQSAGHMEIDVGKMGIDILVFTGHKGLFGPQGTGGFYVGPGVNLRAVVYGGTGYDSKKLVMDSENTEYEVGTQNIHGIAGLLSGVEYILQNGIEQIRYKEQCMLARIRQQLCSIQKVTVYAVENSDGPLISFNIQGLAPSDVAYILANNYDIRVRSGFHCAPLIHEALGTAEKGTVRVSVSCFNTEEEVESFLEAIRELEQSV